jgi:hypothetical protein
MISAAITVFVMLAMANCELNLDRVHSVGGAGRPGPRSAIGCQHGRRNTRQPMLDCSVQNGL